MIIGRGTFSMQEGKYDILSFTNVSVADRNVCFVKKCLLI